MSKYCRTPSWVDQEFPAPIAREYKKRHWKWRKAGQRPRPYIWSTAYAWALRRAKRFEELERFEESQRRVRANWAIIMELNNV